MAQSSVGHVPHSCAAPIVRRDRIPKIISSTQTRVERVSEQCPTSVSQGPTRGDPRVSVRCWCSKFFLVVKAKVGWNILPLQADLRGNK
eukprot:7885855-Pyramimonas_sp.AAC.1